MSETKVPPSDRTAELSVIGCCLLDAPARDDVLALLRADDFYSDDLREIFRCIAEMHTGGITAIDALTVADNLEKRGRLEQCGGPARIVECLESVPHAAHATYYAGIVVEHSKRRQAISAGTSLARQAYDRSEDINESLTRAEQAIHSAMEDSRGDEPLSLSEVLAEAIAEQSSSRATQKHIGTGWSEMDDITPGVPMGGLVVLAARPGMGKSALAGTIALRTAEAGTAVLYCSYEMTRTELTERFLSAISGVEFFKVHRNRLNDAERQRLLQAAAQMNDWPFFIDHSCRNQSGLGTMIRRTVRRKAVKLVVVDYIQLIDPIDKRISREQQVSGISRQLKLLAMELKVGVICLAQMNREVEKRASHEPILSDLRESGSLEQDADQVWFLWRPNLDRRDGNDDFATLKIAKHRNGPTGKAELRWHASTMRFSGSAIDPFCGL